MYGAITIGWGGSLWVLVPDSPLNARFLSEEEKRGVVLRINENETGFKNKTFKKAQVRNPYPLYNKVYTNTLQLIEAITDIKTWLFFLFSTSLNIPNGIFINVRLCAFSFVVV